MNMKEIKAMAKRMGVAPGTLKKAELIRTIQKAEHNNPCFDTAEKATCGQDACLWRKDCVGKK